MIIREEAADSSHSPSQATSPSSGRRPHGSATILNQAPNGRSGRGFLSGRSSLSQRTRTGTEKPGFSDSLNQPQGKMTMEKSLTPCVAGRLSPVFLRPSLGSHERLQARGSDVTRRFPTALSRLRLARILHQCHGRSTRQTQWAWRQASERLLLTEIIKQRE